MPDLDRRKLIQSGIAMAIPLGALSLLCGCQQAAVQTTDNRTDESANGATNEIGEMAENGDAGNENSEIKQTNQENKGELMQIQYLEIVTPDVDALCKQYSSIHDVTFGEPDMNFGNARIAKLDSGGMIGIRGPMRGTETPVVRPYMLVDDLDQAVAKAGEAGAEIAIPRMEMPGGSGSIAIVILGGIECGFWQT